MHIHLGVVTLLAVAACATPLGPKPERGAHFQVHATPTVDAPMADMRRRQDTTIDRTIVFSSATTIYSSTATTRYFSTAYTINITYSTEREVPDSSSNQGGGVNPDLIGGIVGGVVAVVVIMLIGCCVWRRRRRIHRYENRIHTDDVWVDHVGTTVHDIAPPPAYSKKPEEAPKVMEVQELKMVKEGEMKKSGGAVKGLESMAEEEALIKGEKRDEGSGSRDIKQSSA